MCLGGKARPYTPSSTNPVDHGNQQKMKHKVERKSMRTVFPSIPFRSLGLSLRPCRVGKPFSGFCPVIKFSSEFWSNSLLCKIRLSVGPALSHTGNRGPILLFTWISAQQLSGRCFMYPVDLVHTDLAAGTNWDLPSCVALTGNEIEGNRGQELRTQIA